MRLRVLTVPSGGDHWLSTPGDKVEIAVPGGRVTFSIADFASDSSIVYCRLEHQEIRQGLLRPTRRGIMRSP